MKNKQILNIFNLEGKLSINGFVLGYTPVTRREHSFAEHCELF